METTMRRKVEHLKKFKLIQTEITIVYISLTFIHNFHKKRIRAIRYNKKLKDRTKRRSKRFVLQNPSRVFTIIYMGRPGGQPNEAQPPPVQPTVNRNNQGDSQNGAIGHQANIRTGIPVNNQTQNRWSSNLFDCMNDSENG